MSVSVDAGVDVNAAAIVVARRGGHSRNGGRTGRHSMQTTDLPAISDLLKQGQEILVQIAKEPIAKKGARITSPHRACRDASWSSCRR